MLHERIQNYLERCCYHHHPMPPKGAVPPSPRSPEDAAAQARHVGRADGLQQEILGAFLQAPDDTCKSNVNNKQKRTKATSNRHECFQHLGMEKS
jgi:hypothetical protein